MMLCLVLCRFSVSVVKQKLDFFPQHFYQEWWATPFKNTAAIPDGQWCWCSGFGKMLIKAIASCLVAALAVNFGKEIISAKHKLVHQLGKSFEEDYFRLCPQLTIYPLKVSAPALAGKRWGLLVDSWRLQAA